MTVAFDVLDLALEDLYGDFATRMNRNISSKYQNCRYI